MTNSTTERFLFFWGYYYRKLFSKPREEDAFRRKFYRITRWGSVAVLSETKEEIIVRPKKNKPGDDLSLCLRTGNSSDVLVFGQVFMEREYKSIIKKIQGADIRFIVDAGANIGLTSIYFQQYFKDAFFLVIEPDAKNMHQLQKNFELNKLTNHQDHLAGLWSSESWLKINKNADDDKEWAYYVTATDQPTDLKGVSLQMLLNKSGFDVIDILKIDIEGGEEELFSKEENISPVLQKTRFLVLEVHDHLADRQHILAILKKNNFTWVDHQELTIATNQSLAS